MQTVENLLDKTDQLGFLFRLRGEPVLHIGPVAAGRQVSLDDQLRQELARRNGIVAFDSELDAVVESIYGNRKDQVNKKP